MNSKSIFFLLLLIIANKTSALEINKENMQNVMLHSVIYASSLIFLLIAAEAWWCLLFFIPIIWLTSYLYNEKEGAAEFWTIFGVMLLALFVVMIYLIIILTCIDINIEKHPFQALFVLIAYFVFIISIIGFVYCENNNSSSNSFSQVLVLGLISIIVGIVYITGIYYNNQENSIDAEEISNNIHDEIVICTFAFWLIFLLIYAHNDSSDSAKNTVVEKIESKSSSEENRNIDSSDSEQNTIESNFLTDFCSNKLKHTYEFRQ